MKRDYPELENKKIKWTAPNGIDVIEAIVVGCNYDIGITIVDASNKKRNFVNESANVSNSYAT